MVDLAQFVLSIEFVDRGELAGPSVGEEEADVIEVHADRREIVLDGSGENVQRGFGARIDIDIDRDEAERRIRRHRSDVGLGRLGDIAPDDAGAAL